jgi:hypothetical protein
LLFLLIFLLNISCGSRQRPAAASPSPSPSQQSGAIDRIKVTENHTYQLDAIFSGEYLEVGDRTDKVITSLTLKSKITGQEVRYNPESSPAKEDTSAYFTEVWSPEGEWLVLPLGRFSGFCIIQARDALASIEKQKCSDNLYTRLSTRPKLLLWHDFEKWDGDSAFIFKAGLFGDLTRLRYDITTSRLTVLDPDASPHFIEASNNKGKIAIERH